jgi:hypothetical protein
MSVGTSLTKVQVDGAGAATPIAFNRKVFASSDVVVEAEVVATGALSTLIEGTDYSVSGAGNASTGVTVTPLAVIPVGTRWTVYTDQANTQNSVYDESDRFPAKTTEYALDKNAIGVQELEAEAARSLKLPITDPSSAELPRIEGQTNVIPNWNGSVWEYLSSEGKDPVTPSDLQTSNFTSARAIVGATLNPGDIVYINGHTSQLDGGQGRFQWDATSTDADDDGTIIKLTDTATGRLVRDSAVVSLEMFGAVGNGIADNTTNIQAAVDSGIESIYVPKGTFLVDTFASSSAISVTSNLRLFGEGKIVSTTSTVSNRIFNVPASASFDILDMRDISFGGANRWRILNVEDGADINTIHIDNITTDAQSIVMEIPNSTVRNIDVTNCIFGDEVTALSTVSPQLYIVLSGFEGSCNIIDNTVYNGTETINGAFFLHGLNHAKVSGNKHINLGGSSTEGYDFDRVGKMVTISDNQAIGSGFEYKTGSDYEENYHCVFTNNVSFESWTAGFTFRSPCNAVNCIAFNPSGKGFFLDSEVDPFSDDYDVTLTNCQAIYNGAASFTNGFDIATNNVTLRDCDVIIDAKYLSDNPSAKLPSEPIRVFGDGTKNLKILGGNIGASAANGIIMRADPGALSDVILRDITFGDNDDSFIDIADVSNVYIDSCLTAQSTSVDRPFRLSSCSRVAITSNDASLVLAFSGLGASGVTMNGVLWVAAGASNPPPDIPEAALNMLARNTDDNTMWIKISTSTTPSSQWLQI